MANNQLEKTFDDIFGKKAPKLPEAGKKLIVQYAPWLSLIGGLLSLWSAYALWHWAHVANAIINYANSLSQAIGGSAVAANRMTTGIWLSVIVLIVQAVLLLTAFTGLRDRKKQGWNMVYYATLVYVVYGVILLFTDYGGAGNFIGTLIGAAIALYFLFQIRGSYVGTTKKS